MFGPIGIVVCVDDTDQILAVVRSLRGQPTCTLHLDGGDTETAFRLLPIVERKAGRILANGFPTDVEVCDTMVHGGPYPASTNFGATSVGTLSIRRFLRPSSYQNMPESILPIDLVDGRFRNYFKSYSQHQDFGGISPTEAAELIQTLGRVLARSPVLKVPFGAHMATPLRP